MRVIMALSLTRTSSLILSNHLAKERCLTLCLGSKSCFHTNRPQFGRKTKAIVPIPEFTTTKVKKKESFLEIIRQYERINKADFRYADFIVTALKYMDEFGVNRDLEAYKKLLDIMPKGKYIPTNMFQAMFPYYPRQEDAAITLLMQMEHNAVVPDAELQQQLLNIFGAQSRVIVRCGEMLFWMSKFLHVNPWPAPKPMPEDPKEVALLAINKISSADVQAEVTVYTTDDVEDAIDKTWIVSTTSPAQRELLEVQPTNVALCIEGPFFVWFADKRIDYFVLKGPPIERDTVYLDPDDVSNIKDPYNSLGVYAIPITVHEQEEGTYYAMCATGTSTKDSLLSWVRLLEKENPILQKIPVVFKLRTGIKENEESQKVIDSEPEMQRLAEKQTSQIADGKDDCTIQKES